jgi:NADH-ubiquinone oxidoreductase chain 3
MFNLVYSNYYYSDIDSFIIVTFFSVCIASVLLALYYGLSYIFYKQTPISEKVTFECGFDPSAELTFRPLFVVRHMVIALFFLVFDLEIILMAPCILSSISGGGYNFLIVLICLACTFFLEFEFHIFHIH